MLLWPTCLHTEAILRPLNPFPAGVKPDRKKEVQDSTDGTRDNLYFAARPKAGLAAAPKKGRLVQLLRMVAPAAGRDAKMAASMPVLALYSVAIFLEMASAWSALTRATQQPPKPPPVMRQP